MTFRGPSAGPCSTGTLPATTSPTVGSIGADAALRWTRPVTYQSVPACFLPNDVASRFPG